MSANLEDNLSRIREIVGIDDPDGRMPELVENVSDLLLRCDELEGKISALEADRDSLTDEVAQLKLQVSENTGFFKRLSQRLKK
ncbi:MAG: hypothetical protein ACPGVN_05240 [Alphaproteobacteria bacterium]